MSLRLPSVPFVAAAVLLGACASGPARPPELAGATLAVPAGWTRVATADGAPRYAREGVEFDAESLAVPRTLGTEDDLFRYMDGVENNQIRAAQWRLGVRRTDLGSRRDATCLRRRSVYDEGAQKRRIASVSLVCRHPADAARVVRLRVGISEDGISDQAWADAQFARLLPLLQPWVDGLVFVAAKP